MSDPARSEVSTRTSQTEAQSPPPKVCDLAKQLGATGDSSLSSVVLTQCGLMRNRPDGREMRFDARQTISLQRPEFAWRARTGPFRSVSVLDAFKDGEGELDVRLLGFIRLAHIGGPAIAKGEIMRYLAELAWAPDAFLTNPSLEWRVVDARTLRVSAGSGPSRGEVDLLLDDEGRIGSITAPDRPYADGARMVERPWFGRFSDYREHNGRWLPFAGEVGWVADGQLAIYWRGKLLSWDIA